MRGHVAQHSPKVRGCASGRVSQREERDPHGPDVGGTETKLCGRACGGARLFCVVAGSKREVRRYIQDQKVEEKRLAQLNGSRESPPKAARGLTVGATWGES